MKNVFEVEGLGLQVDKTMIMPGSRLVLSRPAPAHWARFGVSGGSATQELTVATPEAAVSGEGDDLQAQAKELGIEVDGRWGDARIQAEIDKALAE